MHAWTWACINWDVGINELDVKAMDNQVKGGPKGQMARNVNAFANPT
jgi:hypothetical protein